MDLFALLRNYRRINLVLWKYIYFLWCVSQERTVTRQRSWVSVSFYVLLIVALVGSSVVAQTPCSLTSVSITNTGAVNCVGVASLSASSSQAMARIDWFNSGTLVSSANAQSAVTGSTVAGGNGQGSGLDQLNLPQGVFVDASGAIYVADYNNHRVQKWLPGATSGIIVAGGNGQGTASNQLNNPTGVFVDASGAVYVACSGSARVQKWAAGATSGTTVAGSTFSGSGTDQLNGPQGIVVDASGAVYVADVNNYRVQKWAAGATSGTTVAGGNGAGSGPSQFSFISGISVDASGAVYVADGGNNRIMKWAKGATSGTVVAGGNGTGNAANQLNSPRGLYVNSNGDLYIADMTNQRVQKWAAGATSGTTVAGGNGFGFDAAYFNSPIAVWVDGGGSVYVADFGNNRIQKWLSTNVTYVPGRSGVYSALITGTNGCTALTNSITVTSSFSLTISASPSLSVTPDQRTTLMANGADSYTWSTGETTGSISVNTPTVYSVTGLSGGCIAVSSITVVASPCVAPVVSISNTGSSNCLGVASLSIVSDQSPLRVNWYKGTTLVSSSYAFTATTIAGGNGPGSMVNQLDLPEGIFVDASGTVYVADFNNHRVQKWTAGATSGILVAGGNGQGNAVNQLDNPNSVFVDASGALYVGDRNNNRIMKWAPGAMSGTVVAGGNGSGSATNQLNNPEGLYVDATGNVYITDFNNYRVIKWAPGAISGTVVAGGNGKGNALNQLNNPVGLWLNASGAIFISDGGNRVVKWAPGATSGTVVAGGNGSGSFSTQLYSPRGIYVDASDAVYVADMTNQRVQKWAAGATSGTTVAGGNGYGTDAYGFNSPIHVFVDASGAVYVTDFGNHRVQKWRAITGITTYVPQASGSYTARVTSTAGCSATTSGITIELTPNLSVVPTSKTITEGQSVTLTAYNATSYRWPDNTTSASLVVSPAVGTTTYSVTGTSGNCSKTATATISVTACNLPTVSLANTGAASCIDLTSLTLTSNKLISQADWYNGSTLVYTTSAQAVTAGTTVAGDVDAGEGLDRLSYPSGIFVSDAGVMYIADYLNNRVLKWLPGATSGSLVAGQGGPTGGSSAEELNGAAGVFVDAAGAVYVVDQANNRVQKWLPDATSGITVAGGNDYGEEANQLAFPAGVFVDASGAVYVADMLNNRIQKWAPGATSGVTVAGGNGDGSDNEHLSLPTGIYVDAAGAMYISDAGNSRVMKWAAGATSGTVVAGVSNNFGSAANLLDYPVGVYVDAVGSVFVVDQNNNRIQKWVAGASSGITVAGGNQAGSTASLLDYPTGVYLDRTGAIYVTDGLNNRVQKWESGEAELTYTPSATGTYKVVVTMPNGCTVATNDVVISGSPSLTMVPASKTISAGMSASLTVLGGTSFTWSSGQSTSAIVVNPTSTTAYSVTVANASGCVSETSATVTVVPAVTAQIGNNMSICSGTSTTLSVTDLANRPNVTYYWSTGSSASAIVVSPTSTTAYSVTIADAFGGYSTTSVTVTVNPAVTATIGGSLTMCAGQSTSLTASDLAGGQGAMFLWSTSDNTDRVIVSPASTTAYSVTVTNASGCWSVTTVTVSVNASVAAGISGNLAVCKGNSTTLTALGAPIVHWSTSDASSELVVSPVSTTAYSVTVSSGAGCQSTTSVTVTVNPAATANIGGSLTVCPGLPTILTASNLAGEQGTVYIWSTGASTAAIEVSPLSTTAYSVTATSGLGCQSTASVTVTVNPAVTASISGNQVLCEGQPLALTASGGKSYKWSTGATTSFLSVTPLTSTNYSVTVVNDWGCQEVKQIPVTVNTVLIAKAISATASAVLGPGNCVVRITGDGIGDSFVITGPSGYVFSNVYRVGATYSVFAEGVTNPGVYIFNAYYRDACGRPSHDSYTFEVKGNACR